MSQCNKVAILGEFVNYHQDHILLIGHWYAFNEIQIDDSPRSRRYWQGLQQTWSFDMLHFGLLTDSAFLNIHLHSVLHIWPSKQSFDSVIGCMKP